MELEVFWARLAQDKLQDIFFYYKHKASLKVARKIIKFPSYSKNPLE